MPTQVYTFFAGANPGSYSYNGTGNTVQGQIWIPGYNGNVNAISFYKDSSDTGTHTAFLWSETGPTLLGSQAFSGETSSGWQTVTLTTPVAVTANARYRIGISHNTGTWGYRGGDSANANLQLGTIMKYAGGCWVSGSQSAYPSGTSPNDFYLIDVAFEGPVVIPDLRASQVVPEVWVADTPVARASQTLVEVWAQNQPPTSVYASQDLTEVWATNTGAPTAVRASQALAEVWTGTTPTWRRRAVSSQAP
jgi:hypothetical protein